MGFADEFLPEDNKGPVERRSPGGELTCAPYAGDARRSVGASAAGAAFLVGVVLESVYQTSPLWLGGKAGSY